MNRAGIAPASTLTRRLAGDSFWIAIDTAAARGGSMIAMLIAARSLGPSDFGALITVQATVMLLSSIVSYAMRLTTTSELARLTPADHAQIEQSLVAIMRLTLVSTLLLTVLAVALHRPMATHLLGRPDLAGLLLIGVLLLVIDCVSALQLGILTGCRAMREGALCGAIASIALVAGVAVGTLAAGTVGAMWGLIVGGTIGIVARWIPSRRALRQLGLTPRLQRPAPDLGVLSRTSLPLVLMNLLWTPTMWLGSVLLVRSTDGYTQMGLLGAANQWFAILLFLPNVLGFSTMPLLANGLTEGGESAERFRAAVRIGLRSSVIASLPLAVVAVLASPWIMQLYGAQYGPGWPTLALLAAAVVPASQFGVMANVLTVTGRWRPLVMAQAAWAFVYLAVSWIGLSAGYGAFALAAAMLAGNLLRALTARRALAEHLTTA